MSESLTEEEKEKIYDWLDTFKFSRPKKSVSRDFSDAVLTAELLKNYYKESVDLNNYPAANSVKQKIYNWNTLNNKVLKKLKIPLSNKSIEEIANSTPGAIEKFLKHVFIIISIEMDKRKELSRIDIEDIEDSNKTNENKNEKNNDEIDYKNIIYNKDIEIDKLKKELNELQKKIKIQQKENTQLKEEILNIENNQNQNF